MGYTLYKHTAPSGKVYIGITSQNVMKRWQNGIGYSQNVYFARAIKKYGWSNIKHEILLENLSKEQACAAEIALIEKHKSYDYRFGYNISRGGELGMSKPVCKYSFDGELVLEYPTLVDAAIKENIDAINIRACCRGKTNATNGFIWRYKGDSFDKYFDSIPRVSSCGKVFTAVRNADYKQKIFKYNKCGELLCIYDTVYDIPDLSAKQRANIIRCCRGHIKTALGYAWRFNEDDNITNNIKRDGNSLKKKIVQYDTEGNIVKIWDSIIEAKMVYHSSNIDAVLCGKRHTACGYVWRYENEHFHKYNAEKKKPTKQRKYDNMPVYQYDKAGNFIYKYNDVYEISKQEFVYGNIVKCLLGKISYTNGYIFTFTPKEVYYED